DLALDERPDGIIGGVVEHVLVVVIEHSIGFDAYAGSRTKVDLACAGQLLRISIQVIEVGSRGNVGVMIVANGQNDSVQVPQHGNAAGILKPAVVNQITQNRFGNWILLQRGSVMQVDAEISYEN